MKFEHTEISNFENAFRGLRNPLESWSKSDSKFGISNCDDCDEDLLVAMEWLQQEIGYIPVEEEDDEYDDKLDKHIDWLNTNGVLKWDSWRESFSYAFLGPKDIDLAHRMIKAGTSDSKFLRQIFVSVDITGPLYWWKEMDTYKVATVANSTSTMHKLASTPITMKCFETDDYNSNLQLIDPVHLDTRINQFIQDLEQLRQLYNQTKDKKYWKELIRWLPESWLQTRTWTANYAVLRNIYFQRKNHKLTEWHQFCEWIEKLPYAKDLIIYE